MGLLELFFGPAPKPPQRPGDVAFPPQQQVHRTTTKTVQSSSIPPDGSITTAKLADGALSADAAGRTKMADGFVNTAKIAAGAVDASKVAADVATQAELDAHAALSKSAAHPGTVGEADIADDAVTAAKLKDHATDDAQRAVTTNHIRDGAVTAAKVAADVATQAELDAHKTSSDHDGRYFTEAESDARFAAIGHTHACQAIISGGVVLTGGARYMHPMGGNDDGSEASYLRLYFAEAGTLKKLRAIVSGSGAYTLTLRKNGADSALQVSWNNEANTLKSDDDTVAIAAGDYITIHINGNTGASWSLIFERSV